MSKQQNGNKWRYRCPEGHVQWKERRDGYYCEQCEVHFDHLQEAKPEGFHY